MSMCQSYVFDSFTKRKRKCKNKKTNKTTLGNFCFVHLKQLFSKQAIIIQKMWRKFRSNKKINILFKPLPREIQLKVLFYMKEPYLLEKYHYCKIRNIINNRVNNLYNIYNHEELVKTCNLLIKYNEILSDEIYYTFSNNLKILIPRFFPIYLYKYRLPFYESFLNLQLVLKEKNIQGFYDVFKYYT